MFNSGTLEYAADLGQLKVLTHAEAKRQYKAMRNGDLNARNLLIESSLKWIKQLVSNYTSRYDTGMYYEDILQDVHIHICSKIHMWRPSKGKLSTFVAICTRNVLLQWYKNGKINQMIARVPSGVRKKAAELIRDSKRLDEFSTQSRNSVLAALPFITGVYYSEVNYSMWQNTMVELESDGCYEDYSNKIDSVENHIKDSDEEEKKNGRIELVSKLLELCTEKERELIKLHYFDGLDGQKIGDMYGVTKSAINARLKKLLSVLRFAVDNDGILSRKIYTRNCPQCSKTLNYKTKFAFGMASRKATACHCCAKKNSLAIN